MWPWGHFAVGYILYSIFCRYRRSFPPSPIETIALLIGTQFPDLLGKPLAWTFGILPSGRSLFHSLLTCALILGSLWYLFVYVRSTTTVPVMAFTVGYLSHLFGDILNPLLNGEFSRLSFLLWPILSTPDYETQQSFIAHFTQIDTSPFFTVQLLLLIIAVLLWIADDAPGYQHLSKTLTMKRPEKQED